MQPGGALFPSDSRVACGVGCQPHVAAPDDFIAPAPSRACAAAAPLPLAAPRACAPEIRCPAGHLTPRALIPLRAEVIRRAGLPFVARCAPKRQHTAICIVHHSNARPET